MISRLFWLTALSLPLLSCSMKEQDSLQWNNDIIKKQNVRTAGHRGMNINMIDSRLSDLVNEAGDIEVQMTSLMNRLNDLRADIAGYDQTLVTQNVVPEAATQAPETVLPVPYKPQAKPQAKPAPQQASSKPKVHSNAKGVHNVRIGVHKDKTRLVFDVNGATTHSFDFDPEANILTMSMPTTPWTTRQNQMYKLSQLSGYDANPQGAGSVIALSVKNTSSVKTSTMKASGGKPARLVIDLMK